MFHAAMLGSGIVSTKSAPKKILGYAVKFCLCAPLVPTLSTTGPGVMKHTLHHRPNAPAAQEPYTPSATDRLRAEFSERMDHLHHLLQALHFTENPIQFQEIFRELDRAILEAKALAGE